MHVFIFDYYKIIVDVVYGMSYLYLNETKIEELKMSKCYRNLIKGDIFIFNLKKATVTGSMLKNGKMIISTTEGVAVKEPFEKVTFYSV